MSKRDMRPSMLFPSLADIVFLCIFLSLSLSQPGSSDLLADSDTGYHIRAGESIMETLSVPRHDIFSFLSPPPEWTAHEWLSEVIMALVHKFGGLTGVVIFFAFMIAAEFSLLFKMLQSRKGNLHANILISVLAIGSSQVHWLARPHVFSLVLSTIWYFVLDKYQYESKNYLYFLPFVMLLWVNLHGGFVIGFMLTGSYLAGNILHCLLAAGPEKSEFARKARGHGLLIVFCLLAALINPYGLHILLFPFKLTSTTYLMDNVQEFLSPNFHKQMLFKYLVMLMVVILAASKKRMNSIEIILVLIFTNMALYSARYIPFFAIIIAPILSLQAGDIIGHAGGKLAAFFRRRSEKVLAFDASLKGGLWSMTAVLVIFCLAAGGVIHLGFDATKKPVAAVEFLKKEHIQGNMFDNDEFGDYIIYAAWPQYRVFFDGRSDMYGVERMKDYFKVARLERGWEEVLSRYHIDWIIYTADSPLSLFIDERADWKLIYADKVAHIYVRNIPAYASLIGRYPDVKPLRVSCAKAAK